MTPAFPTRRSSDLRKDHAKRLRPVGQRRVMKMVRPGPDIEEDQRPEMKDRQAIAVNRPLRLLGHEIIHHREEGHGQEKGDRIMSVPPLRQRTLHPGEGRIALRPEDRAEEHTSELQYLMLIT